jgi:hypothetical protein
MPEKTTLYILSERAGAVEEIREYLDALEDAYNNIYAFELFIERAKEINPEYEKPYFYGRRRTPSFRSLKPFKDVNILVLPEDKLQLTSVVIQSPGFWALLGSLFPLEVIRKYLADRHERRKDREYKEELEREKMTLENEGLRIQIMQSKIDLLKSIGVPEDQIRQGMATHIYAPLGRLERVQDRGLIQGVSTERPQITSGGANENTTNPLE